MTVASETNRSGPYTGNGVTTVFDYEFRILDEAHISVIRTEAETETVLTLNSDYTAAGIGDDGGGSITMLVAPTAAQTVTIVRDVPFTQETDLGNQGPFFAETIEAAFDLAVMRDQQLSQRIDDGLHAGDGDVNFDARGRRIINLADPVEDADASSKQYVDDTVGSAVVEGVRQYLSTQDAAELGDILAPMIVPGRLSAFLGGGINDDAAGLLAAIAEAPGGRIYGRPGARYKVGSMTTPANMLFDLNGATLAIDYEGTDFAWTSPSSVSAGIGVSSLSANRRTLTLAATPTGIVAGSIIGFAFTDSAGRYPICYRQVTSVLTGPDRLTVHAAIPFDLPAGTTTVSAIAFSGDFALVNGTIDLADLDDPVGGEVLGPFKTVGYRNVCFEGLSVINMQVSNTSTDYVFYNDYCYDTVYRDINVIRANRNGGLLSAFRNRKCTIENFNGDGDGFGLAPVNCDDFDISNVTLSGRNGSQTPSLSVRGVRPIGCLTGRIRGTTILGFDSALKIEDCGGIQVSDHRAMFCNTGYIISSQNPQIKYGQHQLTGFHLSDIASSSGAIWFGDELVNDVSISNGLIERCQGHGISFRGRNNVVSNIAIRDWGLGAPSTSYAVIAASSNGVIPSGYVGGISAELTADSGQLGFFYDQEAVELAIGPHAANVAGRTFDQRPGFDAGGVRHITAGTSSGWVGGDKTILVDRSGATSAVLLTLSPTPVDGEIVRAVDIQGNAHIANVNVTGSHNIDGASFYSINHPYGWVEVQFSAEDAEWHVIDKSIRPGVVVIGYLRGANFNSTADQQINIELPKGYNRYRLLGIVAEHPTASAASAVGGIYTAAAKGGTAVVANTQVFTSLTGANTNQQLSISTAGAQINGNTSMYLSLTTPHGSAVTADIHILAYVFP
ncbi:hypothetical protein ACVWWG_007603 [Bradyrhizobium sp. LB7.2]